MKLSKLFLLAGSVMVLASCNSGGDGSKASETDTTVTSETADGTQIAVANLVATADSVTNIGSAKFFQLPDGEIRLDLDINMPSRADSNVAVHFHEHGDCGDMGNNTHGHWNPTKENHGKWGTPPFHSGDIGNIPLDSTGKGFISVTTDRWSVSDTAVNNIIGKGIIVHGGTDDYVTQPTGNSGPRVGCGVITKL
ncbi:MAG: superoxide dismutase family protein [Niabella sp.]